VGTTSDDIFGAGSGAERATPGSYGERPSGYRLPDATRLGPVRLQVADLARSLAFYQGVLGLRVVERFDREARLAAEKGERAEEDERILVELLEVPGTRPGGRPGRLGLYHVAILLPDRASLGRLVRHLAERGVRPGAGDHLVSEAFYLRDPDGLGIEVYADRPRSAWRRVGRELMLATDPVDVDGLVHAAGAAPWRGMPAGTVVGHVHLHVGDIAEAAAFYVDGIGFDRISWSYPGALFLGAGGYHHHLGVNTWAGPGARAPQGDEAQLLAWTIEVPEAHDLAAIAASLAGASHAGASHAGASLAGASHADASLPGASRPVARVDGALATLDPWGTRLRLVSAGH
jgi:catechol 2,3-dioxygenase